MSDRQELLRDEALRLYRRYAVEIVEALGFCPYAERCRLDGRTREVVVLGETPDDPSALQAIEDIAEADHIEIGLILFPEVSASGHAFHRWVEHLRKLHTGVRGFATLALEGFHPEAEADVSRPERLTPFLRRTPDPTVQLTRLSVLERVRRGTPQGTAYLDLSTIDVQVLLAEPEPTRRPLHERIAENNLESVTRLGLDAVKARIEDIQRDRDRSYARLR